MIRIPTGTILVALAGGMACASMHAGAPVALSSVSDSSIFAPLTLPPLPSDTRLANGAPGPGYWQNRADYNIAVTLDTVAGMVRGTMQLRYTNNSPTPLPVLWIQTEQNTFRTGAPHSANAHTQDTVSSPAFGDIIDSFTEVVRGVPQNVQLDEHWTETRVTLPEPLHPGHSATFEIAWHFIVPVGTGRMGRQGSLYEMAQWYPRVNVYDDVKGWNIEPYLSRGEFYLEYGDYALAVTVPADFIVAATGTLDNPSDVLTPTERVRLTAATQADTVVHIVTAAELKSGVAHLRPGGMVTWKFHAQNVRDAVWCASPDYVWDATHWHSVLVQAFYRPPAATQWRFAADMVRTSIQEYSERWYPYPYRQVSAVEGPVGGMEYPMLSMDGNASDQDDLYGTITHETGHNWFPMVVGSNERVHAWMDEGINTFINTFSEARRYPEHGDQTARGERNRAVIERAIAAQRDERVETPADSAFNNGYIAYRKPAGILQMLRRDIMGPARFDAGFRHYIQQWAYKHPTPEDFFRTMDDAAGQRLDWFWREWFLETPRFDQAIDSVVQTAVGTETHMTVVYGNHARGVLPLLVRFTFSNGTTNDLSYPADVWRENSTRYAVSYIFPGKRITRIALDPDNRLVDIDRSNNVWTAP